MPERQDVPDLDDRAQPQTATTVADQLDDVEGYPCTLDDDG
jgi:hypothetical protein